MPMVPQVTLLHHPDPRLHTPCAPVMEFGPNLAAQMDEMLAMLPLAHPGHPKGGVGLAGPQVGLMRRVLVMQPERDGPTFRMCNPVITPHPRSRTEQGPEGCLSFVDLRVSVERQTLIGVTWREPDTGRLTGGVFTGWAARIVQHEVDHLDGRTILHHARPAARREYERRFGDARRVSA